MTKLLRLLHGGSSSGERSSRRRGRREGEKECGRGGRRGPLMGSTAPRPRRRYSRESCVFVFWLVAVLLLKCFRRQGCPYFFVCKSAPRVRRRAVFVHGPPKLFPPGCCSGRLTLVVRFFAGGALFFVSSVRTSRRISGTDEVVFMSPHEPTA